MRPNNAIHLTVNSRLRRLLPAGDRERSAASETRSPEASA
jgi:hypothetical protein